MDSNSGREALNLWQQQIQLVACLHKYGFTLSQLTNLNRSLQLVILKICTKIQYTTLKIFLPNLASTL